MRKDIEKDTLFDPPPTPDISALGEQYLQALKVERNASPHTLINYEIDLRHFFKFLSSALGGSFTPRQMTELKKLREFLSHEMESYGRSTVLRRLSVIKGFFRYLHREGVIEKNVAKLISLPRPEETLPKVLKPEEVVQLLDSVPAETLRQKRIRAIIELLYSTGMRISELIHINHEALDFRNGVVRILAKGNKERVVPMGRHCQRAISEYIDAMPSIQKRGPSTPLFLNQDGARLSVRTVQRDLRKLALDTLGSTGVNVSPHTLRHSCATHLLAGGAGLREIQELLGHRSLVTTQKYTQLDMKRLKASYKQAHPQERRRKEKEVKS